MKVCMIGLGKLGTPVSCAMESQGHEVYGYDIDAHLRNALREGKTDLHEPGLSKLLRNCLDGNLHIVDTLADAVTPASVIFIAVPTPSLDSGAFDTSIVKDVLVKVASIIKACDDYKVVSIISTVLPMTTRDQFLPVLKYRLGLPGDKYGLCYNAQFIAMGTVVGDMLEPEFVLVGEYDPRSGNVLRRFYEQLTDAPVLRMSLENAEVVKLIYNTMIGLKIVYANTIMELCDKVPSADCDVVHGAITRATGRLLSTRYLRGGMGDGGSCHPRDQRALSWLAQRLDLYADPFDYVMTARDDQTRYLADMVRAYHKATRLPVAILGLTFKPKTNLTDDSPSLLLIDILHEFGITVRMYDPIIKDDPLPDEPHIYVLATAHEELKTFPFVSSSVVVDVWRMLDKAPPGCMLRRVGGA